MLTEVVVTGFWPSPDGVRAGSLVLTLSGDIRDDAAGQVVAAHQRLARLDADGRAAVQVYATDSADGEPADRVYWVEERIVGASPRAYALTVPSAPAGSRAVDDAITAGTGLLSATAEFTDDDLGAWVTGDGLDELTTIAAVLGPTAVTLSKPVLRDGAGLEVLIGAALDLASV